MDAGSKYFLNKNKNNRRLSRDALGRMLDSALAAALRRQLDSHVDMSDPGVISMVSDMGQSLRGIKVF